MRLLTNGVAPLTNISGVAGLCTYSCVASLVVDVEGIRHLVEQFKIAFCLASQSSFCNGNQGVKNSLGFWKCLNR